ncbi:MAG: helix-turn-helix transcriptional regulator [Chloroflexi bacterium]|nr:helix-turn-helix transcriptional regulator [Chloroflexota bacterium]
MVDDHEPCYVISVAAKLLNMHPQTLRYYERLGLIKPGRSDGRIRLYSQSDIDRLAQIRRLMTDLGVNLAGVEVIMHLTQRIRELERDNERLREALGASKNGRDDDGVAAPRRQRTP